MFKEDIIGIKQKSQLYRVVSFIGWSVISGGQLYRRQSLSHQVVSNTHRHVHELNLQLKW
jgi:hypothetical protein